MPGSEDERDSPEQVSGGGRGSLEAPGPAGRPTWVVVLTSLMVLFGAQLFFSGMTTLRALHDQPAAHGMSASERVAASPAPEEALVRELANVSVDRSQPGATRAHALAQLVLALVIFFVVAAIFSSDPRGRAAALLVGWLGIAYHVGNALFFIVVVRQSVLALAPSWVDLALKRAGSGSPLATEDLLGLADTLTVVVPLVTAGVGIAFCVVLLAFFGGRRGRLLYGRKSEPVRLPNHGG